MSIILNTLLLFCLLLLGRSSDANFIINGDFQTPALDGVNPNFYNSNNITGWSKQFFIMTKKNYAFQTNMSTQFGVLMSGFNSKSFEQNITGLSNKKKYVVAFKWQTIELHSSNGARIGFTVQWNNKTIFTNKPTDLQIHKQFISVQAQEGDNVLAFISDSKSIKGNGGTIIDNVTLTAKHEIRLQPKKKRQPIKLKPFISQHVPAQHNTHYRVYNADQVANSFARHSSLRTKQINGMNRLSFQLPY